MLTFIILAGVAVIALFIGFFDIRLPFINKKNPNINENASRGKQSDPVKSIEAFYRSVRAESWLNSIQLRQASDAA